MCSRETPFSMMRATCGVGSLGLSVVLLVSLSSSASSLPVFSEGPYPTRTNDDCVNPEECCVLVGHTDEFNECCKHHGCCPMSCHDTHGERDYNISQDCHGAWGCCRFQQQTTEFHKCCKAHGCCPPCDQESRGCCHNGVIYEWGSVVEDFPELCLQFVCAVRVSSTTTITRPALNAVIVPVTSPSLYCEDKQCNDCLNYQCVDQTGLIRSEGEMWVIEGGCRECVCTEGSLVCQKLEVNCPQRPHRHCVEIPGPCCPEWDCTIHTRDCSAVLCEAPPRPNCLPIIPEGECCAVDWRCDECPDLPCPGPPRGDCKPFYTPQVCCPEWNCSPGCAAALCQGPPQLNCRPIIPEGECCAVDWVCPDCSAVLCEEPPQPGCQPIIREGECCAVDWVCPNCSTVLCKGPPRSNCRPIVPEGDCCAIDWICPNCSTVRCAGPPHPYCQPIIPVGECCAVDWVCPNCAAVSCARPPHSHCIPILLEGKCCAEEWICGCVDHQGVQREEGESWKDPVDPCRHCLCHNGDVECLIQDCPAPPPWPCSPPKFPGQCCPNYCDPPIHYFDGYPSL